MVHVVQFLQAGIVYLHLFPAPVHVGGGFDHLLQAGHVILLVLHLQPHGGFGLEFILHGGHVLLLLLVLVHHPAWIFWLWVLECLGFPLLCLLLALEYFLVFVLLNLSLLWSWQLLC